MPFQLSRRSLLLGGGAAALTGCSGEPVWAPETIVAQAFAPQVGTPSLTLYTMKNVGSGSGAHTSVLVNASQRVMFDPAGTFGHPTIPERNDVLFGMTPRVEEYYVSYHARETFFVIGQTLAVPAPVAEAALRAVMANGPVAKANCTRATSALLRQLPGLQSLPQTWFPNTLSEAFAALPGVQTREYREDDADDKSQALRQIDTQIRATQ